MNIYIDSTNGNDAADSNLYKTLDYVLDYIATLSDSEFNIYLKNGNYGMKQHNNLFTKTNIIVNIIGTGPNVILEQTQPFYFNSDGGGVETFNLNVNKLVYNISNINHNYNCFKFIWNFNNVVFNKSLY